MIVTGTAGKGAMTGGILGFLGGIGLFLFGMDVMTRALRDVAGRRLRDWLGRFTQTTLRGVITGAVATAIVQSSSAVTVMTIGFVGAGLIGFSQSLGVLYGANIGTTLLGWIVMVVGVKLQIGIVAMPVLLLASLLALLGRGIWERLGRLLAGSSLLFIGLDVMQAAMAGAEMALHPDLLPKDGFAGRLLLVVLGAGLVAMLQSSGAGVAVVLVMIGAGQLTFGQGAALVGGMNIGTTVTGLLASLGGSRPMRMTALANLLFNLITALILLPALPLIEAAWGGRDPQFALVLFHSGFNVLGTLIFLPMTSRFVRLVQAMVPERRAAGLAAPLERGLLEDEATALAAAERVARAIANEIALALSHALSRETDLRPLAALPGRVEPALTALSDWLSRLRIAPDHAAAQARFAALLHVLDHLSRFLARAGEQDRIGRLVTDPELARAARVLVVAMQRPLPPMRYARLDRLINARGQRIRRARLSHEAASDLRPVLALTDALRWLERVADHAERIAHYLDIAAEKRG
jgi:phosphate:Na+ symporter